MNRFFGPRVFLVATGAVAAIAATAGFSAQGSTASSPAAAPRTASLTAAQASSASMTTRSTRPVCVKSGPRGHCQFGRYAGITGASSHPYVDQNVWGPIAGWHQTLHATSPGNWYVTANMPAGNTGVVSYPNTGFFYNKALSRFRSIVSSFSVKVPTRAGTNAEASYDIWFDKSPINEVMIQNDYSPGRGPSCGTWTAQRVRFGGSRGVPVHRWDLCVSGSTAYWETATGNLPTAKINVLAMLKWLVKHGKVPARAQLGGFSYGFEISSTGGARENFRLNSFSAHASSR